MSDPMTMKWAIVDLLKICDAAHEGRLHGDLARIARTLGVELLKPTQEKFVEALGAEIEKAVELDLRKARKAASASAALRSDEKGVN